jgi:hypothetical protein
MADTWESGLTLVDSDEVRQGLEIVEEMDIAWPPPVLRLVRGQGEPDE